MKLRDYFATPEDRASFEVSFKKSVHELFRKHGFNRHNDERSSECMQFLSLTFRTHPNLDSGDIFALYNIAVVEALQDYEQTLLQQKVH